MFGNEVDLFVIFRVKNLEFLLKFDLEVNFEFMLLLPMIYSRREK